MSDGRYVGGADVDFESNEDADMGIFVDNVKLETNDPEPEPPKEFPCGICDKAYDTEQGAQIHRGRAHKQSARTDKQKERASKGPAPKKSAADVIDGALRTSKAAGKLSTQSTTLLAKVLGVVMVLVVVRAINVSRTPPLGEREVAQLELDQAQLEIMFKPLFDALGSSKVVANGINELSKRRDYLLCGVYWYQYIVTVKELAQSTEIKAPQPTAKTEAKKVKDDEPSEQIIDQPLEGIAANWGTDLSQA